jgi:hypothetical protein
MNEPNRDPDKAALRERAAKKLAERRARIRRIRKRTAATGAAIFAVAWGGLLVQLTTGNDPALAGESTSTGANTKSATATQSSSSGSSSSATTTAAGTTSAANDNGSSSQAPSAVTTSQS